MKDQGEVTCRARINCLMKEEHIHSKVHRKFKAITNSNHDKPVFDNVLNRQFKPEAPDQVYAGDITYFPTRKGWLYFAVFIDLFFKRVVGWSMSHRIPASLVYDALTMAIWNGKPCVGLIVHSDRSGQYPFDSYKKLLNDNKYVGSTSRKGNCWDNAPSESFFYTLKTELVHHEDDQTREEAKRLIFEYIVVFL